MAHRRCSRRHRQKARDHGHKIEAPIEAVLELGQVARHMLATDGMVAADDSVLDAAQQRIYPVECRDLRAGSLKVIPGKHAQPTGIEWQRFTEPIFHAVIGNAMPQIPSAIV